MNNLNTVMIEGQLTRTPSLGTSPAQTQMCRLSIANNRYYLDKDGDWKQDPSYFTVHVYGNVASACVAHLKKGRGVRVVGRLKQYSWLDHGIRREKVYILAEHIEFQPAKKSEPLKEPEQDPNEFYTKSSLKDIEDFSADTSVGLPAQEPSDSPADVPDCTVVAQEDNDVSVPTEPEQESQEQQQENDEEDYNQAVGF